MKRLYLVCVLLLIASSTVVIAQQDKAGRRNSTATIPPNILIRIIRAEDERRCDESLLGLLADKDSRVRRRAALAVGRIGDVRAVPALSELLLTDREPDVRQIAAFALGEIESPAGGYALTSVLKDTNGMARAQAVEALGKVAAAFANSAAAQPPQSKAPKLEDDRLDVFKAAILEVLRFEAGRRPAPDRLTVLLGLTAVLRARPEGAGPFIVPFLDHSDPRIVADALNTMSRLRLKDNNDKIRQLLLKHPDPIVRANAARVAGAAEDKGAYDALLDGALHDDDLRVRVSAIRALGSFKDARAAEPLLSRAKTLFIPYQAAKAAYRSAPDVKVSFKQSVVRLETRAASRVKCCAHPVETNELLEIASTLARVLPKTGDKAALSWLERFREEEALSASEIEISIAGISPDQYLFKPPFDKPAISGIDSLISNGGTQGWRKGSSVAQGLALIAREADANERKTREAAERILRTMIGGDGPIDKLGALPDAAFPDILRAYAAFKPTDLDEILRKHLAHSDFVIQTTAAELLGELPPQEANRRALIAALPAALADKESNDAALAILDALGKQKTAAANDAIKTGLNSSDHLLRRKAFALLQANGVGDFSSRIGTVKTRNMESDYRRAIARIGKQVRATVETSKGAFTIEFLPADAPLTVDNFVQLARKGYFNGQTIPRVVPNFVVQAGDPRGDQNGGPGYQIRCELNEVPFERAAVGMALSGKDTGGSQWFVTHAPQPHLDGGYTVFGRVVSGMDVVDRIARGDIIRRVTVSERR